MNIFLAVLSASAQEKSSESEELQTSVSRGKALSRVSRILKSKGITKLPSASTLVTSSSSSESFVAFLNDLTGQGMSGTPPTLISIPGQTIKNLFWRSGVVDAIAGGTATQDQCQEFHAGNLDGQSGGFGACQMAEGVGRSFQMLLDAERSLCYMKNLPTKANLRAGTITLVKGKLPNDDITKIFSPGEITRLIKVNTSPINDSDPVEHIFIRIPSRAQNTRKHLLYQTQIYFCPDGEATPRGYNLIQVSDALELTITIGNSSDPFGGGGANSMSVTGHLTPSNGSTSWDATQARTSAIAAVEGSAARTFKALVSITPDELIYLKQRHNFDTSVGKHYVITRFSGTDVNTVRFLEGAFKGEDQFGSHSKTFSGASEYRDTFYSAAPSNALLSEVIQTDLSSDSFFTDAPTVDIDTSSYSCSARSHIELTMARDKERLEEAFAHCFHREFRNIQFCQGDPIIQQARQNFPNACSRGPRPG